MTAHVLLEVWKMLCTYFMSLHVLWSRSRAFWALWGRYRFEFFSPALVPVERSFFCQFLYFFINIIASCTPLSNTFQKIVNTYCFLVLFFSTCTEYMIFFILLYIWRVYDFLYPTTCEENMKKCVFSIVCFMWKVYADLYFWYICFSVILLKVIDENREK